MRKRLPGRIWVEEEYLPSLDGSVLYVGVEYYTNSYHERVKNPEGFRTVDIKPELAKHGSPFGHLVGNFLEYPEDEKFDNVAMYGIFGSPHLWTSDLEVIREIHTKGFRLLRDGGTLMTGPNFHRNISMEQWDKTFSEPPFEGKEVILHKPIRNNVVWWGRK